MLNEVGHLIADIANNRWVSVRVKEKSIRGLDKIIGTFKLIYNSLNSDMLEL